MGSLILKIFLYLKERSSTSNLSYANAFNLVYARILSLGKGLTHYQSTNFRLVQIETVCRWQFKNLMKIPGSSLTVQNTLGKGEIAHYEQFLLFPQRYQKACFPGASKGVIVWEWVSMKGKRLEQAVSSSDNIHKFFISLLLHNWLLNNKILR